MAIYEVSDRETISDVSSSIGFTSSKLVANLIYAFIQAVDGNIRFSEDGTTPTSSLGVRLLKDGTTEIWGTKAMSKFRCIDDGGTAKLEVIYYKR
ncbi:hypothetical protein LCGC14_0430860 [marine sediment metagenome]|uniref:Uncharacterized protein n=1 Tax=marine sediment metagenome TaxID=412755 RepID=A0A0F9VA25_9ZZZZ